MLQALNHQLSPVPLAPGAHWLVLFYRLRQLGRGVLGAAAIELSLHQEGEQFLIGFHGLLHQVIVLLRDPGHIHVLLWGRLRVLEETRRQMRGWFVSC